MYRALFILKYMSESDTVSIENVSESSQDAAFLFLVHGTI